MSRPALVKKVRDGLLAAHRRTRTESDAALAESRRLYARIERLADARLKRLVSRKSLVSRSNRTRNRAAAVDEFELLRQAESEKIKSGRPGIWRSLEGFLLVKAVEHIRAENEGYSIARTLRKAIKTDRLLKNCKPMHRISPRALEARYQQAFEYWSPVLENELTQKLAKAREQMRETSEEIHQLCDLIDGLRDLE